MTSLVNRVEKMQVNASTKLTKSITDISKLTSPAEATWRKQRMSLVELGSQERNSRASAPAYLQTLSSLLKQAAQQGNVVSIQTNILDGLYFPAIKARQSEIKEAYPATFDWILQDEAAKTKSRSPVYFAEWLKSQRQEDGLYWIGGKPGSGKSTLMKYLYSHERTHQLLKQWAGTKELFVAGFFFWHSGTEMQKSQEGLLRTLLFEILRHNPNLIEIICPERWDAQSRYQPKDDAWSREELFDAFRKSLAQQHGQSKFCFFLDGLDEYSGDPSDMVKFIASLPTSPDIKLCVSSRKWTAFIDEFTKESRDPTRKLYLEELTTRDIQNYIENTLGTEVRFRTFRRQNSKECQNIIEEITSKASGVFLWVVLVVSSLRRGLVNGDSMAKLHQRLRESPKQLNDYFRVMFDRVEGIYQADAAKIYELALLAVEPLSLMVYSFLEDNSPDFGTKMEPKQYTIGESSTSNDSMKRNINARCTDLLEVTYDTIVSSFWNHEVKFLHRTVREYLVSEISKPDSILKSWRAQDARPFNPQIYLCQALLVLVKRSPKKEWYIAGNGPITEVLDRIARFAHELQETSQCPQMELLDQLEKLLDEDRKKYAKHASQYHGSFWYTKASFLEWAVQKDLHQYVSVKLYDNPSLVRGRDKTLLECAVVPSLAARFQAEPNPTMVALLFKYKADPNHLSMGKTPWSVYLKSLPSRDTYKTDESEEPYVKITEMFLDAGADRTLKSDQLLGEPDLAKLFQSRFSEPNARRLCSKLGFWQSINVIPRLPKYGIDVSSWFEVV